jgi:hypothetical protein
MESGVLGYMIQERLKALLLVEPAALTADAHLDEDTTSAFVEARLGDAESLPIISHLIACRLCRGATAQLTRLESEITDEPDSTPAEQSPNRIQQFLTGLASRIIPSSEEDVVFAYQSPTAEPDQDTASTADAASGELAPTETAVNSETGAEDRKSDE